MTQKCCDCFFVYIYLADTPDLDHTLDHTVYYLIKNKGLFTSELNIRGKDGISL